VSTLDSQTARRPAAAHDVRTFSALLAPDRAASVERCVPGVAVVPGTVIALTRESRPVDGWGDVYTVFELHGPGG